MPEASFSNSKLKSAALLELMKGHISGTAGEELKRNIGLVYELRIAPKRIGIAEEVFVVNLKNAEVSQGPYSGKPDACFSFVDADFLAIASGRLSPPMAFIRGKMKIKGSMKAAQKFTPDIFPKPSKL